MVIIFIIVVKKTLRELPWKSFSIERYRCNIIIKKKKLRVIVLNTFSSI